LEVSYVSNHGRQMTLSLVTVIFQIDETDTIKLIHHY